MDQADRALFLGQNDLAESEYQSAYAQSSDPQIQAAAQLGTARVQMQRGETDLAVSTLQQVGTQFSDTEAAREANYFLAQAAKGNDDPAKAAAYLEAFLAAGSTPIDAYLQIELGDLYMDAGNPGGAVKAYESALQDSEYANDEDLKIKQGRAYAAMQDYTNALRLYLGVYDATGNEFTKAEVNLLAGQVYLALGIPEQANARFLDSVNNYPRSYDSYSALVALVDANVAVDPLNRALVDYFAGQYGVAVDLFKTYLESTPDHNGTAHYYRALALRSTDQYQQEIAEWDALIKDHPGDRFWLEAWKEKAYTQWAYLDDYAAAAQTLLDFVQLYPDDSNAPELLFEAGRIQERYGRLTDAAATWERVFNDYPSYSGSYQALFLAGVTQYRLKNYAQAEVLFQRTLVLGSSLSDQSAASLWVGKAQLGEGQSDKARQTWQQAAAMDPTGYYSERAKELLEGTPEFRPPQYYDLAYDLDLERSDAEQWLRTTFNLAADLDLSGLGDLAQNTSYQRGLYFWKLGLLNESLAEFDNLRQALQSDPAATYRLTNELLDLGFYREAILASRQILNLANMDDASTLDAPVFFNHIRFGVYFKDLVLSAAQENNIHPLLLLSVIRQESMFEGYARSSAGARGLMQLIPSTGAEIATTMNWPANYTDSDLDLPAVNLRLGARYLANQRDYFGGELYAALAAYNAGPGNAAIWWQLSDNDPDLFLEIIRYSETQNYIRQIAEFMNIYRLLYERAP
ncbi:soluble lytic murein transglycosylase [Longilinea arvoryzae]|uniref:Soluble lytic murein transglycosylase n=1 Tax=Longilinea arvoryzae TaxID=360412 RepID=A0A0S7BK81_9CHLR|nr:soluble lytic murein transglycosylase [Longilinea arvoryzae]